MNKPLPLPFTEVLKSIPGFFGIRLEEEPAYEVVDHIGDIAIRQYRPALLAEVTVPGTHDAAVDEAFDRLARFIFGANARRAELPMVGPLGQRDSLGQRDPLGQGDEPQGRETRLPMTVPVVQQKTGGAWTLSFFLSNDLHAADRLVPDDASIRLTVAPERLVAVLPYGGTDTVGKRAESRERLLLWAAADRTYRLVGDVAWAQYDAPFVLPFVKKNEAQVDVLRR